MARQRGITTIVDGAHALAHFPFKLRDLEMDFYGVSLHKWLLAPTGTGLLYVRKDRIASTWPLQAAPERRDTDIRKFEEIGTSPAATKAALNEAIAFHQAIGIERSLPATAAVVASHPVADALSWMDNALLVKDEDWTEFTLNIGRRGTKLWYEVANGKVQADWAEVVFLNGESQVVDFAERTQDPGLYPLLDFGRGRIVDHVRMVARSKTDDARVALRLEN